MVGVDARVDDGDGCSLPGWASGIDGESRIDGSQRPVAIGLREPVVEQQRRRPDHVGAGPQRPQIRDETAEVRDVVREHETAVDHRHDLDLDLGHHRVGPRPSSVFAACAAFGNAGDAALLLGFEVAESGGQIVDERFEPRVSKRPLRSRHIVGRFVGGVITAARRGEHRQHEQHGERAHSAAAPAWTDEPRRGHCRRV